MKPSRFRAIPVDEFDYEVSPVMHLFEEEDNAAD